MQGRCTTAPVMFWFQSPGGTGPVLEWGSDVVNGFLFYIGTNGVPVLDIIGGGNFSATWKTIQPNVWYYVVISRTNGLVSMHYAKAGDTKVSMALEGVRYNPNGPINPNVIRICGSNFAPSWFCTAHIADFMLIKDYAAVPSVPPVVPSSQL